MQSMRQLVVVGLFCGAAFLAPAVAFTEAPKEPAAVDLAELKLRVAEARVVDSVKLGDSELKPAKDEKLVVVTLRGTLPKPGRLTLSPATFKAMYSWTVSSTPPQEKVGKSEGKAVQLGDSSWGTNATHTYAAPGIYVVKLRATNGAERSTVTKLVRVGRGVAGQGGSCGPRLRPVG